MEGYNTMPNKWKATSQRNFCRAFKQLFVIEDHLSTIQRCALSVYRMEMVNIFS